MEDQRSVPEGVRSGTPCVTLPADLETMDLLTTAASQPTLRAAEPRDFEDFFDTRRSLLIRSAEIALPFLMSWDLLVVHKPADASSRSDEHRTGTGGDHSSVPAILRIHTSGRGMRAHDVRQSPLSARILLALPP